MSRRNDTGEGADHPQGWSPEEALAIEQSLDLQMIEHVKELLCTLWKQGRISIAARAAGDSALSAARYAVEYPEERDLSLLQGELLSHVHWLGNQEGRTREF